MLRVLHHDAHPDEHDLVGDEVSHPGGLVQQNIGYFEHHLLHRVRHRVFVETVRLSIQSKFGYGFGGLDGLECETSSDGKL